MVEAGWCVFGSRPERDGMLGRPDFVGESGAAKWGLTGWNVGNVVQQRGCWSKAFGLSKAEEAGGGGWITAAEDAVSRNSGFE